MSLSFAIATSDDPDSRAAGVALAREAAARCAGPQRAALCFATGRHSYAALSEGVRAVLGPEVRLFGGSSVGIISHSAIGRQTR